MHWSPAIFLGIVSLSFVQLGFAAEPPAEPDGAELAEIEQALGEDAAAQKSAQKTAGSVLGGALQSIQPDLSIIGDFALAGFSKAENYQTGEHDPHEKGFNLQQVELAFGAAVDPYFRFDGNIVFHTEGVDLEEAYGTTLGLPLRLQARFGQMLTRFGRANPTHPHSWEFVDQPIALGRLFGGEGNRELGLELSYLTPLPWYTELVLSGTRADGEETARSFYGAENPDVDGPLDFLYVAAIKQFFPLSDSWSLMVGLSGAFGPNSTARGNRTEIYGVDVYLKYRPVENSNRVFVALQSEWMYRHREIVDDALGDFTGYAQVVYKFAQRFSTAGRFEYGSPARTRSGDVGADPLDPEWTRGRTRLALNVTYYPTEFSRLRLQGSRDSGFGDGAVWATFLAAELLIGAHGAHVF